MNNGILARHECRKQDLGVRLDFEVTDSIDKLEALGLLTKHVDADGQTLLQVHVCAMPRWTQ
jgi:hypothetical protein